MKLLEYSAKQFLMQNKYESNKRRKCLQNGYSFGISEFFEQDFWLEKDSSCTDIDFIEAVYTQNLETKDMSIAELIENLARFLCGYKLQVQDRKNVKNLSSEKQHNYFQNQKEDLEIRVTDNMLKNSIKDIKNLFPD